MLNQAREHDRERVELLLVKDLKRYATQAGAGQVHLHQTRHSYARIIAEESSSITDTQDALGHRNVATTRIYAQRIAVKKTSAATALAGESSRRIPDFPSGIQQEQTLVCPAAANILVKRRATDQQRAASL